jgi:hypothetical protein
LVPKSSTNLGTISPTSSRKEGVENTAKAAKQNTRTLCTVEVFSFLRSLNFTQVAPSSLRLGVCNSLYPHLRCWMLRAFLPERALAWRENNLLPQFQKDGISPLSSTWMSAKYQRW